MKFLDTNIKEEIQSLSDKQVAFSGSSYPYNALDDRQFEVLLYSIFKIEIEKGKHEGLYDDISLMQGVGERGRDIALHYQGANVGLIQCKKIRGRVSKPEMIREIVKFTLHYLKDRTLITDLDNFTYYFAVSDDFTGPAIELLGAFNERITKEEDLEAWVKQVIDNSKSLQDMQYSESEDELSLVLSSLRMRKLTAYDLNIKLTENENLVPLFFEVRQVVRLDEIPELSNLLNKRFDKIEATIKQTTNGGTRDQLLRDIIGRDVLPFDDELSLPIRFEYFVGRMDVTEELREAAKKSRMIAILGMPGVGKSVLLNHLVLEFEPKDSVFHYNFPAVVASLNDLLLRLAGFLDRKSPDDISLRLTIQSLLKNGQVPAAIELILQVLNTSENFLFFDSMQNVEADDAIRSFFIQLKINLQEGNVFVASRTKPGFVSVLDEVQNVVGSIELNGFSKPEIREFFLARSKSVDERIVEELSVRFDGLPIALEFVSILLEDSPSEEEWEKLISKVEGQTTEYLFELVYHRLTDLERSLLNTASIFNLPFLLVHLLRVHEIASASVEGQALSVKSLSRKFLLQELSDGLFTVHEIVKNLARTYTDKLDEKRIAMADYIVTEMDDDLWANVQAVLLYHQAKLHDRAAEIAVTVIDTGLIPYYPDLAGLLLRYLKQESVSSERWLWVLGSKGNLATYWRRYDEAEANYSTMLELSKEIEDDVAVSVALQRLGILFLWQGNELAEQYFLDSLVLKKGSKDLIGQAQIYNNLGVLYCDEQRYDDAENALNTGLELHDQMESPEWARLSLYGSLSILFAEQEDWTKAVELGQKTYDIAVEMGWPDEMAKSTFNMGNFEAQQSNFEAAEQYYIEALENSETHGLWQTEELALGGLTKLCFDTERYDDGIEYCKKSIELKKKNDDKGGLAILYFDIANFCVLKGEYLLASTYCEKGIDLLEYIEDDGLIEVFLNDIYALLEELDEPSILVVALKQLKNRLVQKPLSYRLATIYGNLGAIYLRILKLERVGLACLCHEISLLARLNMFKEETERLINLGSVYENECIRLGDSVNAYTEAILIAQENGLAEPLGIALYNRGTCFAKLDKWDQAESDLLGALGIAEDSRNRELLNEINHSIAEVYRRSGEPERAIDLLVSSIEFARNKGDLDGEIYVLNNLGLAYQQMSIHDLAIQNFESAIQMSRRHSKKSLESQTLVSLGNYYLEMGKPEEAKDSFEQALAAAREAEDIEWEEWSMLSLAYAHRELNTFESIVDEFQIVANEAASLEHYDNLLGFLILGAEVNFEQGDVELSTEMFEYALTVALLLGYEQLRQFEGQKEDSDLMPQLTEVLARLRFSLIMARDENKSDQAEELYQAIVKRLLSWEHSQWYAQIVVETLEVMGAEFLPKTS